MRRISSIVEQLLAYEDELFHGVRMWTLARMLGNIAPLRSLYLHLAAERLVIFIFQFSKQNASPGLLFEVKIFWFLNTGLFKMIVRVLTTCRTKYTWDRSICIFLFNRTTLQVFVTYLIGALYVHRLWFYKHQHDNRVHCQTVCSMSAVVVSMAVLISTFISGIHTHPVSWNCAYRLRMELSDGGCFLNLVRNYRWIIVHRQSFWITLYF